jgi:hypothetical protein
LSRGRRMGRARRMDERQRNPSWAMPPGKDHDRRKQPWRLTSGEGWTWRSRQRVRRTSPGWPSCRPWRRALSKRASSGSSPMPGGHTMVISCGDQRIFQATGTHSKYHAQRESFLQTKLSSSRGTAFNGSAGLRTAHWSGCALSTHWSRIPSSYYLFLLAFRGCRILKNSDWIWRASATTSNIDSANVNKPSDTIAREGDAIATARSRSRKFQR